MSENTAMKIQIAMKKKKKASIAQSTSPTLFNVAPPRRDRVGA
jgi:hypothetical protein